MALDFQPFTSVAPHVLAVKKPLMLRGRHGIGKSELVYQIAPKVVSQYSVDFLGTKVAAYVACGFDFVRDGEVIVLTNLG